MYLLCFLLSQSQVKQLMDVQTLFQLCFTYQFKNYSSNFEMFFFSTTSASYIIMSPEFSLLSFHYGIDEKLELFGTSSCTSLSQSLLYASCKQSSLAQTNTAKSLLGHFSRMLGLSFKLYNGFCFHLNFSEYDYFIFQKKSQCPIIFETAEILLRY